MLNELFKQKYDQPLKRFCFAFLKDGTIYEPECITDEKASKKTERAINKILNGIESEKFTKKCGNLCNSCGMNTLCPLDI